MPELFTVPAHSFGQQLVICYAFLILE